MNRTDRLLAIVLELQRRQRSHVRADDLAARFEVSRRTISVQRKDSCHAYRMCASSPPAHDALGEV